MALYGENLEINAVISFADEYNRYKQQGLIPVQIRELILTEMGCGRTTYYVYLSRARTLGYVTDSYKENKEKQLDRQRSSKFHDMVNIPKNEKPVTSVDKKSSLLERIMRKVIKK